MPTAAESCGDFIHVNGVVLGSQTDARQVRREFLEHASDDHRLNRANMVDESFGVATVGARAGEIALFQPDVGDAIVVSQMKVAVKMF